MCEHDIYNEASTMQELAFQLLTYPPHKFYECSVCGRVFEYIFNEENGRYEIVPSKEGDSDGFSRNNSEA